MDAQNLRSLTTPLDDLRHICHRPLKHIRHLRHRGWQDRCHSLLGDAGHPAAQAIWLTVVGIVVVGSMCVNIQKPGKYSLFTVIHIRLCFPVRKNLFYFSVLNLDLSRVKLTADPDSLTLNSHTFPHPVAHARLFCPLTIGLDCVVDHCGALLHLLHIPRNQIRQRLSHASKIKILTDS